MSPAVYGIWGHKPYGGVPAWGQSWRGGTPRDWSFPTAWSRSWDVTFGYVSESWAVHRDDGSTQNMSNREWIKDRKK